MLETEHVYKVFRNGVFLGTIPDVISEFYYDQEIDTAATETRVDVARAIATLDEPVEPIQTEAGEDITTEAGEVITTERSAEIIGSKDSGQLIANNNDIEIWEISDENPNGVLVFDGYISNWESTIRDEEVTIINIISHGKDADDYIVGDAAFNQEFAQTSFANVDTPGGGAYLPPNDSAPSLGNSYIAQSFSGLNFELTKIELGLCVGDDFIGVTPSSAIVTLKLYKGNPFGTNELLATVSVTITNPYYTYEDVSFILPAAIQLDGSQYYFTLASSDYVMYKVWGFTDIYPNGTFYTGDDGVLNFAYPNPVTGEYLDMYFRLFSGGLETDMIFTSTDPSQMLREGQQNYGAQGGSIIYTGSSIENTGLSLDYPFRMATFLDLARKVRDLAPADWYWYVDPATQIIYFKETPTTATHVFVLGDHLESVRIGATIEEIRNVVYFTGGPTAGINLLKLYTDSDSLAQNKRGMERLTDNRVTDETIAQALSNSFMEENSSEIFRADITVNAETYDINSINPGDTVSFAGTTSFIDNQVLQITNLRRYAYKVELTLGKLPIQSSTYIDQIKRDLDKEQTLDNPDQPA